MQEHYAVIRCTVLDVDGHTLWWSNEDGWTDIQSATFFAPDEVETMRLPLDGVWCVVADM
jgi:hypothetical protein